MREAAESRDRLAVPVGEILKSITEVIPQLNNLPTAVTAVDLLDEIVGRSGLMLSVDGGQRYQFGHLTLQEFFAADALRNDSSRMIQLFRGDRGADRGGLRVSFSHVHLLWPAPNWAVIIYSSSIFAVNVNHNTIVSK
jgi:hypothetical protein